MNIQLSLTNFRAIKLAAFAFKKISVLAARNEGGKTTTLQAIAAATTGRILPIDDIPKTQAHRFVHDGTTAAEIVLTTGEGETKILYPSCEMTSTGTPLSISPVSAGIETLLSYDKKQRVSKLSEMIQAYPSKEELKTELTRAECFTDLDFNEITMTIDKLSWDQAWNNYRAKKTEATGEWKQISGTTFGMSLANGWKPPEYEPELDFATEDGLKQQLKTDSDFLAVAQTDQAISESEIAQLKTQSSGLDKIIEALKEVDEDIKNHVQTRTDIEKILAGLPKAEQPQTVQCPHCTGYLQIVNGSHLEKVILISEEEIEQRNKNISDTKESLDNLIKVIETTKTKRNDLIVKKSVAEAAAVRLKKVSKRAETISPEKIEALRAKVTRATVRLSAWQKKNKAEIVFRKIENLQKIIDIIAPDELRLNILKMKLTGFNKTLASVCKAAEWPLTELIFDKDAISINYDARHFAFTSKSAQLRTKITLQIAAALFIDDPLVLIDEADTLDGPSRNGLFRLLAGIKINSVIGMTLAKTQAEGMVSAIAGMQGGIFWIENGAAEELCAVNKN